LDGGFSFPFPLALAFVVVVVATADEEAPRTVRLDPALVEARMARPAFSFSFSSYPFSFDVRESRLAFAVSHWLRETLRVRGIIVVVVSKTQWNKKWCGWWV
jgi:hypothetical protein